MIMTFVTEQLPYFTLPIAFFSLFEHKLATEHVLLELDQGPTMVEAKTNSRRESQQMQVYISVWST